MKKDLKTTYDAKEQEIRSKYNQLINDLDNKYTLPISSDGWYDQQVDKMKEASDYRTKMNSEISLNNSIEYDEERNLDSQKENELSNLRANLQSKITLLKKK